MALTKKQLAFVREYQVDLNATQSAIRAGYSPKTAGQVGHENLRKPEIAEAIAEAQAKIAVRNDVALDRWLQEWCAIAFSDVNHYQVDPGGGVALRAGAPLDATRAVSSSESTTETDPEGRVTDRVKIRLWDKPRALENLGKHLGFYPREFGGEGAPNGRQPMTARRDGEKVILDWGDLKVEL